jgi:DNA topoisomerase IA
MRTCQKLYEAGLITYMRTDCRTFSSKFIDDVTDISYSKKSFVYDFLSSMRQKINDPLGVRAKKRKKINQQ